ncbi:MAG: EscU/YscU/HrcU family type III secretion system export apparatus switch protein [Gammaproteobacteria bacterium]
MSGSDTSATTPTAVALRYNGEGAPRLMAKGRGETAERIVELAKRYGIPIQPDPMLVELLAQVRLDEEIPPVLYAAVAQLLAFIYSLSDERPGPPVAAPHRDTANIEPQRPTASTHAPDPGSSR